MPWPEGIPTWVISQLDPMIAPAYTVNAPVAQRRRWLVSALVMEGRVMAAYSPSISEQYTQLRLSQIA